MSTHGSADAETGLWSTLRELWAPLQLRITLLGTFFTVLTLGLNGLIRQEWSNLPFSSIWTAIAVMTPLTMSAMAITIDRTLSRSSPSFYWMYSMAVGCLLSTWFIGLGSGKKAASLALRARICLNPSGVAPGFGFCSSWTDWSRLARPQEFALDLLKTYWTIYGAKGFVAAVVSGTFLGWLWVYLARGSVILAKKRAQEKENKMSRQQKEHSVAVSMDIIESGETTEHVGTEEGRQEAKAEGGPSGHAAMVEPSDGGAGNDNGR